MKKLTIFIVLMFMALSLVLSATPVYAVPALPHAFYGNLTINGNPAPAGSRVEARGGGVQTGITGNPIVTTEVSRYGSSNPLGQKLVVQGDITPGATITFYVNGVSTGQTAEWHSSQTTELNLTVTIAGPPPAFPSAPAPAIAASLFGVSYSFSISATGEVLVTITATSADGNLTITIPAGTIALDIDGEPLDSLTADVDLSPPDPPEGDTIIGLVYNFGPVGATFVPPITLTWSYDPGEIPEGADLMVMEWDDDANEWVEFDGDYTIDPDTHTVTMLVSHFSKYAIIAHAAPVVTVVEVVPPQPEEEEAEAAPPEEKEEEVVVEEEEGPDIDRQPAPFITGELPEEPTSNLGLIFSIVGGVIVATGLLAYFLWWRKRRTA